MIRNSFWLLTLLGCLLLLSLPLQVSCSTSCSSDSDCGGSDIKHEICSTDGVCTSCSSNSECGSGSVCNNEGYCTLDGLFSSFSIYDIFALISILIGSIVAAGGGLGGGGIFVPVFILIISLQTKSAAALSQATIFGGSIVNLIMNFRESHPIRKHRPLPDLSTILIFEPMLLGGTIIGVILNIIFPDPIILGCLIIVLSYATVRTTRKGIRMWKKESESRKAGLPLQTYSSMPNIDKSKLPKNKNNNNKRDTQTTEEFEKEIASLTTELFGEDYNNIDNIENSKNINIIDNSSSINNNKEYISDDDEDDNSYSNSNEIDGNETLTLMNNISSYGSMNKPHYTKMTEKWIDMADACGLEPSEITKQFLNELEPYIEEEKKILKPMLIILLIWIIVSLFSIFRGVTSIFNVSSCSITYWSLTFGVFPFLFIITFIMCYKEVRSYQSKRQLGWEPAFGDIEWTINRAILYPLIAGFAGLMGGLLGIGGGMIVSPLLLELGVLPRVAAATSALAVLVTSSSATLQFALLGMLKLDYMLFFMCIGIIGTFIGQTAVNHCVKKYGRASVVVFAVAAVIGLAVILMGLDGILNIINGETSMTFSSAC